MCYIVSAFESGCINYINEVYTMKKILKVVLFTTILFVGLLQTNASAVSVIKSYRYDWNTYLKYSHNYHNHQEIDIPSWSYYESYDEYIIGGDWNYVRYEVLNHYSGGY